MQVIRAYIGLIYRQEKLRLLEETVRINQRLVEDTQRLIALGKLKNSDRIAAETEVSDSIDGPAAGREALAAARQDLLRVLGVVELNFDPEGALTAPAWNWDPVALSGPGRGAPSRSARPPGGFVRG